MSVHSKYLLFEISCMHSNTYSRKKCKLKPVNAVGGGGGSDMSATNLKKKITDAFPYFVAGRRCWSVWWERWALGRCRPWTRRRGGPCSSTAGKGARQIKKTEIFLNGVGGSILMYISKRYINEHVIFVKADAILFKYHDLKILC